MIELKKVSKTYVTKKGVSVRALDGIDLILPDTGMVFILGKSGSGKSTLLNLMGGLDKFDSGEMLVKGKSTKNFTQSELDSYRNTSIGFIFQEYNILEEFSVGANIALAMHLQGVKADNERLNQILADVDLTGYAQRKPNELSGGQMQRVAIARALIKNPEIIMADEPTGALDSRTGLQIFDTLKKLSKSKLVLIVSHDREYAELYGDRVIEIADGKVISDIQKKSMESFSPSESIRVIDETLIQIKQGFTLSPQEWEMIKLYISKANSDTYISMESGLNTKLRRVANVNDDGLRESFRPTDEKEIIAQNSGELKFIKSRLPLKTAFKIGASGLNHKKIRLVITIIMTMIALCMFGLADTIAAFDPVNNAVRSIMDSNMSNASFEMLEKYTYGTGERDFYLTQKFFKDADVEELNRLTGMDFMPVYSVENLVGNYPLGGIYDPSKLGSYNTMAQYYINRIVGYAEFTPARVQVAGFNVYGRLPANGNEIAITHYIYEHYKTAGYSYNGKTITPQQADTPDKFLSYSPEIDIFGQIYTITGIVDTGFNVDRLSDLFKENNSYSMMTYLQYQDYQYYINFGYHALAFVCDGELENIHENLAEYWGGYTGGYDKSSSISGDITVQPGNEADFPYKFVIAPMPKTQSEVRKLVNLHGFSSEKEGYKMRNEIINTFDMVTDAFDILAKVFIWVGGFAIALSSLLLMNFIATSISYKKKEIGILRAVGARSMDVFSIFFSESLIIALINFLLGAVASFIIAGYLNNMFKTEYNLIITLLNFGVRQILIMLGVSLVSAFVASFLPVYKTARKKPIDAIRKR